MKIIGHQTHHTIADFESIFACLQEIVTKTPNNDTQLHVFPELFLTGYPLQDLCIQKEFIVKYQNLLEQIDKWSTSLETNEDVAYLLGGLAYELGAQMLPEKIENVLYLLIPGKKLQAIYTKKLLPNYDIFDEKKYFTRGNDCGLWEFQDKTIALMICEDMWYSEQYHIDPASELERAASEQGKCIDLIVNLSASPFHLRKEDSRIERIKHISNSLAAPFLYLNRVGGEDEILFDGRSLLIVGDEIIQKSLAFEQDNIEYDFDSLPSVTKINDIESESQKSSWESLFVPKIENGRLVALNDNECELTANALEFGLVEYMKKCGFKKIVVALSGGIDSALVLALAVRAVGASNVEAIYMQGQFSATISYEYSKEMCNKLGVAFKNLPIKFLHSTVKNQFTQHMGEPLAGLADENIQSRLRGALLYARSNQTGAMVINTSNKSEISVGYSTQYGDSVGAVSLLGDLYKTEVYALANYLNRKAPGTIPQGIIDRPPSAELRPDQRDDQSLPPYEILDSILECFLSSRYSQDEIETLGFAKDDIEKILNLFRISEFKRFQFCPIIKLKSKSYGFGHRIPITKAKTIYS